MIFIFMAIINGVLLENILSLNGIRIPVGPGVPPITINGVSIFRGGGSSGPPGNPIANYQASSLVGVVADGGSVTSWPDSTANGNDIIATVGAGTEPIFRQSWAGFAGAPAIQTQTTRKGFALPTSVQTAIATSQEVEVFFRTIWVNATFGHLFRFSNGSTGGEFYSLSNTQYTALASPTRTTFSTTGLGLTADHVWHGYSSAGSHEFFVNGVSQATLATAFSFRADPAILFCTTSGGTSAFNGYTKEVIIYDRVLSSVERSDVLTYIQNNP